jgi:hypothetical protein
MEITVGRVFTRHAVQCKKKVSLKVSPRRHAEGRATGRGDALVTVFPRPVQRPSFQGARIPYSNVPKEVPVNIFIWYHTLRDGRLFLVSRQLFHQFIIGDIRKPLVDQLSAARSHLHLEGVEPAVLDDQDQR